MRWRGIAIKPAGPRNIALLRLIQVIFVCAAGFIPLESIALPKQNNAVPLPADLRFRQTSRNAQTARRPEIRRRAEPGPTGGLFGHVRRSEWRQRTAGSTATGTAQRAAMPGGDGRV